MGSPWQASGMWYLIDIPDKHLNHSWRCKILVGKELEMRMIRCRHNQQDKPKSRPSQSMSWSSTRPCGKVDSTKRRHCPETCLQDKESLMDYPEGSSTQKHTLARPLIDQKDKNDHQCRG